MILRVQLFHQACAARFWEYRVAKKDNTEISWVCVGQIVAAGLWLLTLYKGNSIMISVLSSMRDGRKS